MDIPEFLWPKCNEDGKSVPDGAAVVSDWADLGVCGELMVNRIN